MASGRMNEACGLVRRLQSILNDQAGADTGSSNASSSPASRTASEQPGPSRRLSATPTTQPGASNPASVTPHQIHQALFGYGSRKRSRSVPVSAAKRGKSSGTRPRPSPWTHEFVCLADSETEVLPTDYSLLAANGLGKAKLQLFEDSDAADIHTAIITAFPKIEKAGGYELLRTHDGSKRLAVITPPPEGYTGLHLKSVLNQAKCYIRPIQSSISLSREPALEENAKIGDSVPRIKCENCGMAVPMIQLRDHIQNTCPRLDSDESATPDVSIVKVEPADSKEKDAYERPSTVVTSDNVEVEQQLLDAVLQESLTESKKPESIKDIIESIRKQHKITMAYTTDEYDDLSIDKFLCIDVRRDCVVRDAFRVYHKRKFDPAKLVKIHFVGEEGVDTGGLRREFWQLLLQGADEKYCSGNEGNRIFDRNIPALQSSEFQILGVFIAMSIVQDGIGFPVLMPHLYTYLTTGKYIGATILDEDIPDPYVKQMVAEIRNASSDEEMRQVFEQEEHTTSLYETGYRKPIARLTLSDRSSLCETVKCHFTIAKTKAELDQFAEGLKTLGVLDYIKSYPDLMREVFVHDPTKDLTAERLKDLFTAQFSEKGTEARKQEEATYILFVDFLDKCQDGTLEVVVPDLNGWSDEKRTVTIKTVAMFFTGTTREPPAGFHTQPRLEFLHDEILATASSCDLVLRIPVTYHSQPEKFDEMLVLSFIGSVGFGQV